MLSRRSKRNARKELRKLFLQADEHIITNVGPYEDIYNAAMILKRIRLPRGVHARIVII